jgi:hypothetical protein
MLDNSMALYLLQTYQGVFKVGSVPEIGCELIAMVRSSIPLSTAKHAVQRSSPRQALNVFLRLFMDDITHEIKELTLTPRYEPLVQEYGFTFLGYSGRRTVHSLVGYLKPQINAHRSKIRGLVGKLSHNVSAVLNQCQDIAIQRYLALDLNDPMYAIKVAIDHLAVCPEAVIATGPIYESEVSLVASYYRGNRHSVATVGSKTYTAADLLLVGARDSVLDWLLSVIQQPKKLLKGLVLVGAGTQLFPLLERRAAGLILEDEATSTKDLIELAKESYNVLVVTSHEFSGLDDHYDVVHLTDAHCKALMARLDIECHT